MNHPLEPLFDKNSTILILGTFPSVKSREAKFYYAHPQNRFWKVISTMNGTALPETIEDKKEMLRKHHIAIWDVIGSCDITGSSDSSIVHVIPNDLTKIIHGSKIKRIYANGNKAYELYQRHCFAGTGIEIIRLPSTSPANAAYSIEKLVEHWSGTILIE